MKYNEIYFESLRETVKNVSRLDMLKNKSILITGATGLIGSAIIDTLIYNNLHNNSNIQIYAAGRSENRLKNRFRKFYDEDFLSMVSYDANKDLALNIKVDYIIHAASNAHPTAYSREPVETMISNFNGMNNLLNYANKTNVQRTLFISSSEVYGNIQNQNSYKEEDYGFVDLLKARACYPSSKRAAETLCASYIHQHALDVVIVRPGHIYGPTTTENDSRVSAQFLRNVISGKNIVMKSAGLQLRSYCYVFDCVSAILTVLLEGKTGEAYNISNQESIATIRDLAEAHANVSGKEIIFENPDDLEASGYNMMPCSVLDASKLESLGWRGVYNLEEGVQRTVNILIEDEENIIAP